MATKKYYLRTTKNKLEGYTTICMWIDVESPNRDAVKLTKQDIGLILEDNPSVTAIHISGPKEYKEDIQKFFDWVKKKIKKIRVVAEWEGLSVRMDSEEPKQKK